MRCLKPVGVQYVAQRMPDNLSPTVCTLGSEWAVTRMAGHGTAYLRERSQSWCVGVSSQDSCLTLRRQHESIRASYRIRHMGFVPVELFNVR
jgi:hypothetical protein